MPARPGGPCYGHCETTSINSGSGMARDANRQIIEMAKRRAKPGSGSDLSMIREERSRYEAGEVVPDLGAVDYVIVGGLATARYMPARMTLDTDVLIRLEDLEEAEAALRSAGCSRTGSLTVGGSTWRMPGGRTLDVIALEEDWVEQALAGAVKGPDGLPYIDLRYLVLMKLHSGRVQDLADISRMLGAAGDQALAETRELIGALKPADVEDLESLIMLGKREMKGSADE